MDKSMLGLFYCLVCIAPGYLSDMSTTKEAWTSEDQSIILPCLVTPGSPVMWIHPNTEAAISYKHNVLIPELYNRMEITGDPKLGRYDLFIKYAKFPDDVGVWSCVSIGFMLKVNVSIIVPPSITGPQITPLQIIGTDHMAWTFTCSAQYANPPVELNWVRLSGPETPYDVILPDYVRSSNNRVAVSLRLVVSPVNLESVFMCEANHPSFKKPHQATVAYAPATQESQGAGEESDTDDSDVHSSPIADFSPDKLGVHGKTVILILIVICLITLLTILFLFICRRKWYWNDITFSLSRKRRFTFGCKLVIWSLFSILLLLSCTISFPVYFKGITIPLLGTDMLMSVSAGSALWMDCSLKVHPVQSLLKVTWTYNGEAFYSQYAVSDRNVGIPSNSSLGFSMGHRTESFAIGQISIWPVLAREDGVYACQVMALENSQGKTLIKWKTFGVFVVTGPYLNYALLSLMGITVASALILILLSLCHLVRCGTPKQKEAENGRPHSPLQRLYERPLMMGSVT